MQTHPATQTLSEWSPEATARLTVTAASIDAAIARALQAVLNVARGESVDTGPGPEEAQSITAPIRGQGEGYGEAIYELANDLLAQIDASGAGLTTARLDGVLATDDGGYSAWGCVLGETSDRRPAVVLSLDGTPSVTQTDDGRTTVDVRLVRS